MKGIIAIFSLWGGSDSALLGPLKSDLALYTVHFDPNLVSLSGTLISTLPDFNYLQKSDRFSYFSKLPIRAQASPLETAIWQADCRSSTTCKKQLVFPGYIV
jgi:hypothetical protein